MSTVPSTNYNNDEQQKSLAKEIAKHKARQQAKKLAIKATKLAAKAAKKGAVKAAAAIVKLIAGLLGSVSLPALLIIFAAILLVVVIYFSTTLFFTIGISELDKDSKELYEYIVEQANKTVDMSKPEQVRYRVPPELIVAALQIYNSEENGKSEKEAVKIMAKALKPSFTYGEFEGKIENKTETCTTIDNKTTCTTKTEFKPFTAKYLKSVEAWNTRFETDVNLVTTEWQTTTSETIRYDYRDKKDKNGNVIKDEDGNPVKERYKIITKVTFSSRAHTHAEHSYEHEDYTLFDRVLSEPPFEYKQNDKFLVEALYAATGGEIRYTEWLTGNSYIGFDGIITPGAGVPPEFMQYYLEAEKIYKVDWYILAAIHFVETSFSTNVAVSSKGAIGHTQFLPCTWVGWSYPGCKNGTGVPDKDLKNPLVIQKYGGMGVDANKDGYADPWDVQDAIYATANYLSKSGYSKNQYNAIYAYNRADWYVQKVLAKGKEFRESATYSPNGEIPKLAPGSFMMPASGKVSSPFGWRIINGKRSFHAGIDIASGGKHVPVVASADGVVTRVVSNCPPQGSYGSRCGGGFGNHVYIKHTVGGKTYEAVYAHLHRVAVYQNQKVKQGQYLGDMGRSGSSTGIHLHFELHPDSRKGKESAVNPLLYISN